MHGKEKLALILLMALMLCGAAFAQTHTVYLHSIDIQVTNDGGATIVERFFLNFPTEGDKVSFRETSSVLGTNMEEWKTFDPLFAPSIGSNNQTNGRISYNEGEQNYLEISYGLSESLMAKGKETAMMIEYGIKQNFLDNFYQSGLWVIPDNTKIEITLPPGAEISGTVEPEAVTSIAGSKRIVSWNGYKSANKLTLNYVLWKKITPAVDLNAMFAWLFRTIEGLAFIAIVIVIILVVVWKRKKIIAKVEGFVENNSLIEEE